MRIPFLSLLILTGCLVGSCSGGGSKVSLRGFLGPSDPKQSIPANPVVTILGRSPDEFDVNFSEQNTPAWPLQFEIGGVPSGELVVFQVTGGDLFGAASFPLPSDPNQALILGAITTGVVDSIKAQVSTVAGPISLNTGIITGIVAPSGGNPFSRVSLLSKADGNPAITAKGPYYFTESGIFVQGAAGFQDLVGSYAFVNVPPGEYIARFTGAAQEVNVEVLSIRNQVSFGYDIP